MTEQVPSVGRIVHYTSFGTPGGEYAKQCRAAVITEVKHLGNLGGPLVVGLAVLNPTGTFFNGGVEYHDGSEQSGNPACPSTATHGDPFRYCACGWMEAEHKGGTWHWPEQT